MLIHLPDETPIIEVIKFAASIGCEIQHSSANVLIFKTRSNGEAQSKARQIARTTTTEQAQIIGERK